MTYKFKFDKRSLEDVHKQMGELAKSYTPRWDFNIENPDVGSAIGLIYASQMYDNIKKTNSLMDKYRIEFVNLLNLSLLPAFPAEGTVTMDMISETVEGTYVEAGTKLLSATEEGTNIVFETDQTVYVTGARIDNVAAISRNQGKIIPFKGTFPVPQIIEGEESNEDEDVEQLSDLNTDELKEDLYLFDYRKKGISQNCLCLYHDSAFDVSIGGEILIDIKDFEGEDYNQLIDSNTYGFQYYSEGEKKQFNNIQYKDGIIHLEVKEEIDKVTLDGIVCRCIFLEKKEPVKESVSTSNISLASEAENVKPEFVIFEGTDLEVSTFMPFGNRASLYSECYLGQDNVFGQKGAKIKINFNLAFAEKLVTLMPEEEEENQLKVIKRKPKKIQYDVGKTAVQKVVFEYYNSRGWLSLPCDENYESVFDGRFDGEISLTFDCPEDIQETTVGAFLGKAIRMRVMQADNCYMQPCIHNMPIISDMEISYEYMGEWKKPIFTEKITGITKSNITKEVLKGEKIVIFEPIECERDCLLMGLSSKPMGAPFTMFFVLSDNVNYRSQNIAFEYSSTTGFRKLKIVDYTDGLRKTGLILVMTPGDFAPMMVEGLKKYWIRIIDENNDNHIFDGTNPKIEKIFLNGINIKNIETKQKEHYFIDNTQANMEYQLPYSNILKSEVFVNEKQSIPQSEIDLMLLNTPDDVVAEYNYLGGLETFFVRWKEVDNFDNSKAGDRHYVIDRMANTLIFGDGINVKIPQGGENTAFTLQVMCCDGAKANLPADTIQTAMDRLPFIGDITNPVPTYGGGDIERPENALDRGAGVLSSKNRLVSALDFEREAKANFDTIHKVKCVNNFNGEGVSSENEITMVVLTKEFNKGAFAFEAIAESLKNRLLLKNEYVLNRINISEPIFVKLEICIWIEAEEKDKIFEIQNKFTNELELFIDPIEGCYGGGWDIGRIPSEHQLRMIMKRAENKAVIRRYTMTAKYIDSTGSHEKDYKEMKVHPFMICTNGEHKVYMI